MNCMAYAISEQPPIPSTQLSKKRKHLLSHRNGIILSYSSILSLNLKKSIHCKPGNFL